jgi:hypothetical protein
MLALERFLPLEYDSGYPGTSTHACQSHLPSLRPVSPPQLESADKPRPGPIAYVCCSAYGEREQPQDPELQRQPLHLIAKTEIPEQ